MTTFPISKQIIFDVFVFLALCVPLLAYHILGKPVTTGFWCNDQSLSYPYKPDSVSQALLLIISFGGTFMVMAITESIRATVKKQRGLGRFRPEILSLSKAYGIFLFGFAANCIFTDTLKFSIGRLRPHFFDLCRPDFDKINCTAEAGLDRFIMQYECTNKLVDPKLLNDSKLSFPSGHASVSLYSALFTIFYLQLRMKVSFSHLLRPTLQLCVMMLAVLCCLTRVSDHKHFATDVLGGSLLGSSLAWLTFYKIAHKVIPSRPVEKSPPRLPRATSVESEPQTPTPLLRPERLVISQGYRNGSASMTKDFAHNV